MPYQLVRMEGLLDVEEAGVVERAQRGLVARPFIRAIRVDGKGNIAALESLPGRANRCHVPARRHFDFDARISVPDGVIDRARQLVGIAVGWNPERDTADDRGRGLDAESLAEQHREPRAAPVRFEIPRCCFDSRARKPIAPYAIAHHGVNRFGQRIVKLPAQDARQQ